MWREYCAFCGNGMRALEWYEFWQQWLCAGCLERKIAMVMLHINAGTEHVC